jgi:hypothetical protein
MSSMVFEDPGPQRPRHDDSIAQQRPGCRWRTGSVSSTTLNEGASIARKFTRLLRWASGAAAVALAVAGCGGGGDIAGAGATPTAGSAQSNPVAAFALAQQSLLATNVPAPAAAASANMISNGGFENGMTDWADWANASASSGQASSGSSALTVGTAAGGAGQLVGGIVAGNTYRLTAQAKVSAASETVYIGINFIDGIGLPHTENPFTQNSVLVSSTGYTTATLDVVAPPNATAALVYVWKNAGSGVAYVDDFSLQAIGRAEPGPAATGNMLVDGGLESGLASWSDWGNTSRSSGLAGVGSSAEQVGTGAGGFGQDVPGILAGSTYRVSALAKVSTPSETGYLGVMFMDAAGTGLVAQSVVFRSTAVSTVQADVTAPAGATKAQVFVWKNAGDGFASIDQISLVRVDRQAPTAPPADLTTVQMGQRTQIVSDHAGNNTVPSIARLSNGTYVTAWVFMDAAAPADAGGQACFVRLDVSGLRVGTSSCVQGSDANPYAYTYVNARPDGGFVLVWFNASDSAVRSQAFDAAGNAVGGIQAGPQRPVDATAAALTGGGYVSVSVQPGGVTSSASMISFQRYASDGTPIGPSTSVGDSGGLQALPPVPLAGGGFAIAWLQTGPVIRTTTVMTRMFAADGTPMGGPVVVSGTPPACFSTGCQFQGLGAISPVDDGGYVVVWWDGFGRGASEGTFARRFQPDGTPTPVIGKIDVLSLSGMAAANDAGKFLFVQSDQRDPFPGSDIQARLLDATQLQ